MNKPAQKSYSTSDLMKAYGLGRNTLRLYEEMGLLTEMGRTEAGYRQFSTRHVDDLKFIVEAKKVGFTLNEIKQILKVLRDQNKMTCGTVSEEISDKLLEIEKEMQTLYAKKVFLNEFLSTCGVQEKDSSCDVMNAGFNKTACCT